MDGFLGLESDDFHIANLIVEKAWNLKADAMKNNSPEGGSDG